MQGLDLCAELFASKAGSYRGPWSGVDRGTYQHGHIDPVDHLGTDRRIQQPPGTTCTVVVKPSEG
ncbi:hypothetical protein [Pseudomonas entomophila]|uniref:hypothetical protein n=1 Tax=Pseudomonas entomophila TaxID=312306 RepID=UPI003D2FBA75